MNTYLITGVSSDVGMEYIRMLEKKGESCLVYGQYYSHGRLLEELLGTLVHVQLHASQCDLGNMEITERWLSQLVEEGVMPTHILHLSATPLRYVKFKSLNWSELQKELDVQVRSLALVMKAFLPEMVRARSGKVVVLLSSCTLGVPPRYMSGYAVAKYALWGLIRSIACEYGDKGIYINGISPGMMETKFLENIDKRIIEMSAHGSLMKRNISVKETCAAIDFLFSEQTTGINGLNLNISGGEYM